MDPKKILLALFLFGGAIMALLGVPLMRGKVPPNGWYGFRVRRTLSDPSVWYPANRYAGRRMFALGVAWVLAATIGYAAPIGLVPYALGCAGVAVAALAVGLFQSFRYLRTLPGAPQPGTPGQ